MAAFSDTFTGSSGTNLTAHTADSGESWTALFGTTSITDANRARGEFSTNNYRANWTPASADYDVEFDLYVASTEVNNLYALGRIAGTDSWYQAGFRNGSGNNWVLGKTISGSYTQLAAQAGTTTLTVGQTYRVRLRMVGTTISLYVDDVLVHSVTDSSLTSAGNPGVRANGTGTSNSTGYHFDNMAAVDYGVDVTAPTLSDLDAYETSDTTATIELTSDEAGTAYAVLTTSATPPSAAQVKAGQDHTGSAAVWSDSKSVTTSPDSFSATGLTAETAYYAYVVVTDAAGNNSSVGYAGTFTTDATGGLTVWANSTASKTVGRDTRVAYGGKDRGDYLGSGTVTLSGTNSAHWQWDAATKCPVPKNGAGAAGTAWVSSPDAEYTITATDDATSEQCVYTITTVAGRADVGGDSYPQLVGTINNTPRGTDVRVAAGLYYRTTDTRINGGTGTWTGDNWTTVQAMPGDEGNVEVRNVRCASGKTWGVKFIGVISSARGNNNNAFDLVAGANSHLAFEDCHFDGTEAFLAGEYVRGIFGPVRHLKITNCTSAYMAYTAGNGANVDGMEIDGLHAYSFTDDILQIAISESSITCDGFIRNFHAYDCAIPTGSGAHADFIQLLANGTTGATIPGTFIIEQYTYQRGVSEFPGCNIILQIASSGAPNSVRMENLIIRRGVAIGTNANNFSIGFRVDNVLVENVISTKDVNNPDADTADTVMNIGTGVVDATVRNCVLNALTMNNSGSKTNENNLTSINTQAEHEATFLDPYASDAGGTANHPSYASGAEVFADLGRRYSPITADDLGGFYPWDGVAPQWNFGGIYADTYALSSSAASISEDGSVTITATLKNSAVDAMRGRDITITLAFGGTAGNSGSAQIVIPAGETSSSVIVTDAGTTTGSWTFTGTNDSDLSNPSALSITVGAGSAPTLQALSLSASSVNENVSIGTKVADISNNSAGSDLSVLGTHAAYFDVVETSTDSWDLVTAAALDRETLASADIIIRETLADAIGNPKDTPFTITINNVNEGPTVSQDPIPVSFALLSTDPVDISGFFSDPEGTALTFSEDTPAPAWLDVGTDGILTPDGTQTAGSYSFDITASDGSLDVTATVSITVAAVGGGVVCRGLSLGLVLSL
jgi:hypothetical protein